jgi:Uma2 family endonuclease
MQPERNRTFVALEDYLEGEPDSQVRHEYVGGEVYAMVGASDRHGLIAGNPFTILNSRLPEHCQAFISDKRVPIRLDEKDVLYYPDILVSCDPRDRETYYRERPCLIVEGVSPHTARLDRFEKFLFYQHLDSLQEYVLVSQDYRQVEVFRHRDQWAPRRDTQGEVPLASVDLAVPVDAIYQRTDR